MIRFTSLSLKNFKCFDSLENIAFGRITLLTGANSAGKSSLYYSILGALQSDGFPLQYSANGSMVLMGDFKEIVYKHDESRDVEIAFTINDDGDEYEFRTVWSLSSFQNNPYMKLVYCKTDYYTYTVNGFEESSTIKYTLDLKYDASLNASANQQRDVTIQHFMNMAKAQGVSDADMDKVKAVFYSWFAPIDVKGLPFEIDDKLACRVVNNQQANTEMAMAFSNTRTVLDKFRQQSNVIGSYRLPAQRSYIDKSKTVGKINSDGEGFVTELATWKENDNIKYEAAKSALKSMGVLYDVESSRIDAGNYKVSVKVKEDSAPANLSDVGYGVAQIMPIVVADVQLPDSSTLFVAQPEIHLHPNVQANMADYFVEKINTTGKSYIIETHSEYMINRLRLAIAKGILNEDDICMYYISQNAGTAIVHTVKLLKNGQICGAPEEFFDTYMMDVMNIAMEAQP